MRISECVRLFLLAGMFALTTPAFSQDEGAGDETEEGANADECMEREAYWMDRLDQEQSNLDRLEDRAQLCRDEIDYLNLLLHDDSIDPADVLDAIAWWQDELSDALWAIGRIEDRISDMEQYFEDYADQAAPDECQYPEIPESWQYSDPWNH